MHLFKQAHGPDKVRPCGRSGFVAGQHGCKPHGCYGGIVRDLEHACDSSPEQAERFAKNNGPAGANSLYPGPLLRGDGVVASAVPLKER